MCSCCCPPAITALFYLWVRSGFSKGTVAGALTFFPPDPPLYKFQRVKDGRDLPDEEDVGGDEENGVVLDDDSDDDESDLGTFEIDTKSSRQSKKTNGKEATNNTQRQQQQQQQTQGNEPDQSQDPIAAMTERSIKLRARAKHRAAIDSRDAKNGVTYRFIPDSETLGPLPSFHGVITPLKIGPQKRTGTYIAALLYQLPPRDITPNTKTILYSHGNASDVGAMAGLQAIIAKHVDCNVLVYDYSGYGESGGVPMEKNTYRDIKLIYEWVVANVTQHESKVILYGQSVGSGPSCYLASRRENVGGLVLHSPFTSGMRVLTPSRALACLDIFPNIDRIKKYRVRYSSFTERRMLRSR
ncbi:hypothetical protein HJC23_001292 [Cyclotella cryptica]|uniref:Serine aminopeptidase S33 domain-containing protein n=1 Tax=Cyclotella cryptica TaxID=29204 RepID=A0ABD3P8N7_9STRA|eukprot:CCRYP_016558-RA/>CCRYP_016558-RA protein AED:0.19 eAED:0.19 QI:0/-1/0/1/-1/1/1/0/355